MKDKNTNKAEVAPVSGQHTPGPWTIESGGLNRYLVEENTGNVLASLNYPTHRSIEEEKSNARLIAAAPELLEALKDMLEPFGPTDTNWQVEKARAAIAKAEGRTI